MSDGEDRPQHRWGSISNYDEQLASAFDAACRALIHEALRRGIPPYRLLDTLVEESASLAAHIEHGESIFRGYVDSALNNREPLEFWRYIGKHYPKKLDFPASGS